MENGIKLMNGEIRKNSLDDESHSPVLMMNGEGDGIDGDIEEGGDVAKVAVGMAGKEDGPMDRIKRKAKRLTKVLSKEALNGTVSIPVSRYLKNSRKPRNGYGRGLPKKGGAGGKHTWGAYGSEMTADNAALDYKDPNYDPESTENGDITLEAIIPEMSDDEIYNNVEPTVLEYFNIGDTNEVLSSLADLNFGQKKYQIVVIAVEAAIDRKPSHRELTSALISDLVMDEFLETEDVAKAFDCLLKNLPDLVLDAPEAPTILGNFIARAVADDCISVGFVHSRKGKTENEHAKAALAQAEVLLLDKIAMLRLHNVWGVGGGGQPVRALSNRIHMLLQEFISSNDTTEAARCLRELEVPHFHHEMVYEAIVMAIEAMSEIREDAICRLLKSFYDSCLITPEQMGQGFRRVFDDLPDIVIDVPAAYTLIERIVNKASSTGFLADEVVREVPIRGRKRFVSEGDGGKVKEETI